MVTILLRTLIVYALISTVFRIMGKRQVGEMQMSELVAALLLSEVAALPIGDHDVPMINAIVPVLIIVCLEIVLTYFKNKCHLLKRLLEGKPSFLIIRGRIDQGELDRMRMSVEELLSECRLQGFPDLSDVSYAILEQDGKLSIIPKAGSAALSADDVGIKVAERGLAHPLILDGAVNDTALRAVGRDRAWLAAECRRRGRGEEEVFLMTMDDAGTISFTAKERKKKQ